MQTYRDFNGDSGISGFELGEDFIIIEFKSGARYKYTNGSAGSFHINQMKQLAQQGDGLNKYIMNNKVEHATIM